MAVCHSILSMTVAVAVAWLACVWNTRAANTTATFTTLHDALPPAPLSIAHAIDALVSDNRVSTLVQLCAQSQDGDELALMERAVRQWRRLSVSVSSEDQVHAQRLAQTATGADDDNHPIVMFASAESHLKWLAENRPDLQQPVDDTQTQTRPQVPLFWVPSSGCSGAVSHLVRRITSAYPTAYVLLYNFVRPQVSNQVPSTRSIVTTTEFVFHRPNDVSMPFTGAQEPSWAFVGPALPSAVDSQLYYPTEAVPYDESVFTDWALLTYRLFTPAQRRLWLTAKRLGLLPPVPQRLLPHMDVNVDHLPLPEPPPACYVLGALAVLVPVLSQTTPGAQTVLAHVTSTAATSGTVAIQVPCNVDDTWHPPTTTDMLVLYSTDVSGGTRLATTSPVDKHVGSAWVVRAVTSAQAVVYGGVLSGAFLDATVVVSLANFDDAGVAASVAAALADAGYRWMVVHHPVDARDAAVCSSEPSCLLHADYPFQSQFHILLHYGGLLPWPADDPSSAPAAGHRDCYAHVCGVVPDDVDTALAPLRYGVVVTDSMFEDMLQASVLAARTRVALKWLPQYVWAPFDLALKASRLLQRRALNVGPWDDLAISATQLRDAIVKRRRYDAQDFYASTAGIDLVLQHLVRNAVLTAAAAADAGTKNSHASVLDVTCGNVAQHAYLLGRAAVMYADASGEWCPGTSTTVEAQRLTSVLATSPGYDVIVLRGVRGSRDMCALVSTLVLHLDAGRHAALVITGTHDFDATPKLTETSDGWRCVALLRQNPHFIVRTSTAHRGATVLFRGAATSPLVLPGSTLGTDLLHATLMDHRDALLGIVRFKTLLDTMWSVAAGSAPPPLPPSAAAPIRLYPFYDRVTDDGPLQLPFAASDMLPFTREAQRFLWAFQHPPSCASAKLAVITMTYTGIGSHVHQISSVLAVAHALGRVVVLRHNTGIEYADEVFCGDRNNTECFFLPLSSCSVSATDLATAVPFDCTLDQSAARVLLMSAIGNTSVPYLVDGQPNVCRGGLTKKHVPAKWRRSLASIDYTATAPHYWWRAQTATYVLRLNDATRQYVVRLRNALYPHGLAPGTAHFHVRHGDKFIEMELLSFARYIEAAEREFPPGVRQGFLSTEDPRVVQEARTTFRQWDMTHVPVRRDNLPPHDRAEILGKSLEMRMALLQLFLALECDYWVCTRESNWCRLIDELRDTVAGKRRLADRFVEVGPLEPIGNLTHKSWYW